MDRKYFTPSTVTAEADIQGVTKDGRTIEIKKGTKLNLKDELSKVMYTKEDNYTELHFFDDMDPDPSNDDHFQALYHFLNFEFTGGYVRVVEASLKGKDPIDSLQNA